MSDVGMALQMQGVSKRYPGTLAVDNVDLEVYSGEVHALVGENGAGKSTLMKMLAGTFADYTGRILVGGREAHLRSPAAAKQVGIEMIRQELSLALPLSIAENVLVGRLPVRRRFLLDVPAMADEARRCLARVGLDLDPLTPVEELSPHEAQLVEIAKALGNVPCILVMDEPTSSLGREEVERLFAIIRQLRAQGLAIVYISHHLSEVFAIADRVTVMRDGRKVATESIAEVAPARLVSLMVGRSVSELYAPRKTQPGGEKVRVERLTRRGFFHDVSFHIRAGEILGLCGLSGAGRSELGRSLCAIDPVDEGEVTLQGKRLALKNYQSAIQRGFAYLSEDRKAQGLARRLNVAENLLSAVIPRHSRAGLYSSRAGQGLMKQFLAELQIHPPDPARVVDSLSGGNQQKVLLAKWLAAQPEVLVLDEPTRGVDIGAKATIHQAITRIADEGKSVLLISSDLPELVALSDRVLVMRKGRLVGEALRGECSEDSLLLAATGMETMKP